MWEIVYLQRNTYRSKCFHLYINFCSFQAFANLLQAGRLNLRNIDVEPYVVDGKTILSEQNHYIQRHYYYAPSYGDDVPSWKPRGKNPRGSEVKAYTESGRQIGLVI